MNTSKKTRSRRVCLLDEKPGFKPQARHQNEIRKVFLRRFPLAKTLRVNKIATKSFSKKSVVQSRLLTVGPATYV